MNQEQEQQEYNDQLSLVAKLAVNYARTGYGYFTMCTSFNDLCDLSGANKGIDRDSSIARRKLLVQSICIKCISSLSSVENNRLESQLMEIAENIPEQHCSCRMHR